MDTTGARAWSLHIGTVIKIKNLLLHYICGDGTKGANGHLTPFVFLGFLDS